MPSLKVLVLEKNPLQFPPAGILQQGAAAVLDYIRRHRHTDMMTTDAERSLKQVLAYRDRLANTIDVYEEKRQGDKGGARAEQPADWDNVSNAGTDAGGGGGSPAATKPRSRNANFFE